MKGSVDRITPEGSVGWLFAEAFGRKPLVQAFLRHQLIGQSVAELYRPDLEQVGMGDGRHGFEIGFNEPVDPSHLAFVTVRPEGYDLTIPVHNSAGFLDLVRYMMADYPAAGRNRSGLGGLWTDRLDAPARLSGRVAVGSVPADLQTALSALIANGHIVMHGAKAGRPLSERELDATDMVSGAPRDGQAPDQELRGALSSLSGFLFTEPLVRLLRAIFDDHPVAYRLDVLRGAQPGFLQACSVEALSSPGECALLYMAAAPGARVQIVRDSHELGEFSQAGRSRWTPKGAAAVAELVGENSGSVEIVELEAADLLLVGPGTVHRAVSSAEAPILRVTLAPRRVTPLRFLSGDNAWLEAAHVSGARLRV